MMLSTYGQICIGGMLGGKKKIPFVLKNIMTREEPKE